MPKTVWRSFHVPTLAGTIVRLSDTSAARYEETFGFQGSPDSH